MKIGKKVYLTLIAAGIIAKNEPMIAMASVRVAVMAAAKKAAVKIIDATPAAAVRAYQQEQKHIAHFGSQELFLQEVIPLAIRNEITDLFQKNNIKVTCIYHAWDGGTLPFLAITSLGSQALLLMNEAAIQAFQGKNKDGYTPEHMRAVVLHELGHVLHQHEEKTLWFDGIASFVKCSSLSAFFYQNIDTFNKVVQGTFQGHTEVQWGIIIACLGYLTTNQKMFTWLNSLRSRCFERQADKFVVETAALSRVKALRDFFDKLQRMSKEEYSWYRSSHPCIKERIEVCEKALFESAQKYKNH